MTDSIIYTAKGDPILISSHRYEELNKYTWHVSSKGYAERTWWKNGVVHTESMHRLILGLTKGDKCKGDHINRVRSDNRDVNLRIVTAQENAFNRDPKGWHFEPNRKRPKKYSSRITVSKKEIFLGYFFTWEEAREAYLTAKAKYHTYGLEQK